MQERIESNVERYRFDSLSEAARYIETTPRKWSRESSRTVRASVDWDLGAGFKRAWDMARGGWLEGAQEAEQTLKVFAPATPAPSEKVDFYGFRPHVPRYCAGAPDSMIRRADETGAGKVLTLLVPVNALAQVNARYMRNFGLAVVQFINQMESEGTRVEVIGAICSMVGNVRVAHSWTVKSADQPLDLAVMAFSIGHPAMFRRIGFALRERARAVPPYGYGTSVNLTLADVINAPQGSIILNGMVKADIIARTPETALAYVSQQIEAAILNPGAGAV